MEWLKEYFSVFENKNQSKLNHTSLKIVTMLKG